MSRLILILFLLFSISVKAQFFNQNTDLKPPTIEMDEATIIAVEGDSATATGNKSGTVYFVKSSTVASIASFEAAILVDAGRKATVVYPETESKFSIYELNGGQYKSYMVDRFERISPASENSVNVQEVSYWNIIVITTDSDPESIGYVAVDGKVTAVDTIGTHDGFYLQDATGANNGIFVSDIEAVASVAIGSAVEILGEVEIINGMAGIKLDYVIEFIPDVFTIDPAVVTSSTLDRDFQSCLITIEGYNGGTTTDSITPMVDGTDTVRLYNRWYAQTYGVGTTYDIIGICDYFKSDSLIIPRTSADITEL